MANKLIFTRGSNGVGSTTAEGINLDTVSGSTETASSVLANGNNTSDLNPNASIGPTPEAITLDSAKQTFYFVDATFVAGNASPNAAIISGNTATGTIGATVYTVPVTATELQLGYTGQIGDVVDNPLTHQLYFTQSVFDDNNDPVPGRTGLYEVSESGGAATRLVSGLTSPSVLALDTADNLVFFTDSTGTGIGGGTINNQTGGAATPVNKLEVANLTTGTVTVLLTEPYVQDPVYGTTGYGGKALNGLAINTATHTLYYTTNNNTQSNSANGPLDGIYSASYTVTGSGSTASATLGASVTLYSGSNAFDPSSISIDPVNGVFYVVGDTQVQDPSDIDYYSTAAGVYEGSLTASNTTALTRVTPVSETSGSVANGENVTGAAIDAAPGIVAGSTVTYASGRGAVAVDSGLTLTAGTSPLLTGATVAIGTPLTGDTLAATVSGTAITASFSAGTLTLSGTDTVANYQAVLDSITFTNTGTNPTNSGASASRTLTDTVTDGVASSTATSTVKIDVPAVVTAGATVIYHRTVASVVADPGLTIQDYGTGTLLGALIAISSGFTAGDTLGFTAQNGITGSYNAGNGTLTLVGGGSLVNYQAALESVTYGFDPATANPAPNGDTSRTLSFTVTDGTLLSAAATSTVTTTDVACFCAGTLIRTPHGEVPVEQLAAGDAVLTYSGEARPIRWVGRRSYAGRFLAANPAVHPIRIRAGALGEGMPARDLLVSPLHALFIDGILVPAGDLVNGHSVAAVSGMAAVHYFHVELDSHDVLFAEGMPAETFLDDDSAGMFHNASTRPPSTGLSGDRYCAPRVTAGYALEAIRRRMADWRALAA